VVELPLPIAGIFTIIRRPFFSEVRMITRRCRRSACALFAAALLAGCQHWRAPAGIFPIGNSFTPQQPAAAPLQQATIVQPPGGHSQPGAECANPVLIPVTNGDLAWEHIVDVVDDYFRVERESRVQTVGNVVTEGRIDTFPLVGATWLEPHLPDSDGWENRWESTFQTIRRQAVLRVVPQRGGYLIDVVVNKELEDLPRPENATAGAASFRNDNSLTSRLNESVSRTRFSPVWIPLGRDAIIEQQILCEIRDRIAGLP